MAGQSCNLETYVEGQHYVYATTASEVGMGYMAKKDCLDRCCAQAGCTSAEVPDDLSYCRLWLGSCYSDNALGLESMPTVDLYVFQVRGQPQGQQQQGQQQGGG